MLDVRLAFLAYSVQSRAVNLGPHHMARSVRALSTAEPPEVPVLLLHAVSSLSGSSQWDEVLFRCSAEHVRIDTKNSLRAGC